MSRQGSNNVLKQRILTALILVPPALLLVLVADTLWFGLVVGVVVVLGGWEWSRLAGISGQSARGLYAFVILLLLWLCHRYLPVGWTRVFISLVAAWWLMAGFFILAVQRQALQMPNSTALKAAVGLIVLIPAWLSLVLLHGGGDPQGRWLVLGLFLLIWAADIGAYFTGKRWGKTSLASTISPGKTWEGALGGLIASTGTAFIVSRSIDLQQYESITFLLVILITVPASIIGDLFESLMKRRANLKDSGNILPGHGGVLDRIDSLSAAGPVFLAGLWLADLFA